MLFGAVIPAAKSYMYNPLFMKKKEANQFGLVVLSACKILIRIAKIAALYQLAACEARFLLGLCASFERSMKDWNDKNLR